MAWASLVCTFLHVGILFHDKAVSSIKVLLELTTRILYRCKGLSCPSCLPLPDTQFHVVQCKFLLHFCLHLRPSWLPAPPNPTAHLLGDFWA
jgi:hypothetical protein